MLQPIDTNFFQPLKLFQKLLYSIESNSKQALYVEKGSEKRTRLTGRLSDQLFTGFVAKITTYITPRIVIIREV